MTLTPGYSVSMTGAQGAGKKTLCEGLARAGLGLRAVEVELLRLGRMVDPEGLRTFRDRIDQQDRAIRAAAMHGPVVTSRLAPLDVAIVAHVMGAFGRIDQELVDDYLHSLERDLDRFAMPGVLVAVLCPAEILAERLAKRDEASGLKAPRGLSRLARLAALMEAIFLDGEYPAGVIGRIVGNYRETGRLCVVDTGKSDVATSLDTVRRFLSEAFAAGRAAPLR